jgi:hypothetical protein
MRTIVLLIACSMVSWGQQSNTVYQTLFSDISGVPAQPTITNPVTNIGQTNHQVSVQFKNVPGHVCADPTPVGEFQYSYDKITWIPFGSPIAKNPTLLGVTFNDYLWFGVGAFPYVRFKLTAWVAVDCAATAYYSGTVTGSVTTQVRGIQEVGRQMTGSVYPVLGGGYSGVGGGVRDIVNPRAVCVNSFIVDTAAAGTFTLVQPAGGVGANPNSTNVRVCSIVVNFISASGTIKFFAGPDGVSCAAVTKSITPTFTLSNNVWHSMENSMGTLLYTGITGEDPEVAGGHTLCAVTTGGTVSIYGTYATITTRLP